MMYDIWLTLEAMDHKGGSFVKSLAECYRHADPTNQKKLSETFSNYFEEYAKKADAILEDLD